MQFQKHLCEGISEDVKDQDPREKQSAEMSPAFGLALNLEASVDLQAMD